MIKSVLIANRGEIAVRIIQAAREEGIETVAVYSEADSNAVHVRAAHRSVCIGPAPAPESYLDADRIVSVAKEAGCDAVHPGYGFLAENADFARKVETAGLIIVGPGPDAVSSMGDKLQARKIMTEAGVPVVPGILTEAGSSDQALKEAEALGYPVLVKAAGGGGGKGMRRVDHPDDLNDALAGAAREAGAAFGDSRVYIEKYLERPRHIEIQVMADNHGNTIHLFERECSIQRRHQKVIEETPSTALTETLRMKMGETAVRAARAVNYRSAGTVEFMLDSDGSYYFLEMNTRIQVEHPVTEMITGIDLVRMQFRVASGETLDLTQADITRRGHSIECRIYAEDPATNFLPSPGMLHLVRHPQGPGVRVDSGIETGTEVTVYYDPILAKVITWGEDRDSAIVRMIKALGETVILGVRTPIEFLVDVLDHPEFRNGNTHTGFLMEHGFLTESDPEETDIPDEVLAAAVLCSQKTTGFVETADHAGTTPWTELGSWKPWR